MSNTLAEYKFILVRTSFGHLDIYSGEEIRMKQLILLSIVVAAVSGKSVRQIGVCAEMCDTTNNPCSSGSICVSNGCGHSCKPILFNGHNPINTPNCQPQLCFTSCQYGYLSDANGCQSCHCILG